MRFLPVKKSSRRWVVFDEIGGPLSFHATQEEAHAAAKKRGAGRTIVYVATILLTNDSAQWVSDGGEHARRR
jgi:hypothetical protein